MGERERRRERERERVRERESQRERIFARRPTRRTGRNLRECFDHNISTIMF